MRFTGFFLMAAAVAGPLPGQNVLHVGPGALGLQQAIQAAGIGDILLVAPGTYYGPFDTLGKVLTIRSVAGAAVTFLDGSNLHRVMRIDASIVLEGFTIQHGSGPLAWPPNQVLPGGLSIEAGSPVIRDCRVTQNRGHDGIDGSSYPNSQSPTAGAPGGVAVFAGHARFERCLIFSNQGGKGGRGLSHHPLPTNGNYPTPGESGGAGGIGALGGSVDLVDCVVRNNTGGNGGLGGTGGCPLFQYLGALSAAGGRSGVGGVEAASGNLASSTIASNTAGVPGDGGSIFYIGCFASTGPPGPPGALGAGGLRLLGGSVVNSIVWGNAPPILGIAASGSVVASHSDLEYSILSGPGVFSASPQFVNAGAGDLRLQPGSPCIDAGTDDPGANPLMPARDFDGHARQMGPRPDLGAFESEAAPWLVIDQPQGPGSASVEVVGGPPGFLYFTVFSFDAANGQGGLGSGPWAGLHISTAELAQYALYTGPPVIGILDGSGASFFGISGLPPASPPTYVYAVTRTWDLVLGTFGPDSSPMAVFIR